MFFNTMNDNANRQSAQEVWTGQCRSHCGEDFRRRKAVFRQMFAKRFGSSPSVSIEEREDTFLLCLYAAGLDKDRFRLSVQDNVLTISYEPDRQDAGKKFIYQEHSMDAFERSFQLNGQVSAEQISAAYVDGVLAINLPKSQEAQQSGQEIKIN